MKIASLPSNGVNSKYDIQRSGCDARPVSIQLVASGEANNDFPVQRC